MSDLFNMKSATISPCGKYRYDLFRWWDKSKGFVMFIGLNPSTADADKDDPTIRRCISFAKRWGYGGICMVNLFAYRATKPDDMKKAVDPVGPDNEEHFSQLLKNASEVVAAWGTNGNYLDRDIEFMTIFPSMKCLGKTKDGHPRHPLYVKGNTELIDL